MNIFKKLFKLFRRNSVQKPEQKLFFKLNCGCLSPFMIKGQMVNCGLCVNCKKARKEMKKNWSK